MKISQKLFQLALSLGLFVIPFIIYANIDVNATHQSHDVNGIIKFDLHKLNSFGKLDKIVIDAGHGGKDHGCSGTHSKEKFIVLDIAKKLGKLIRSYHPEIEVIYTRDTDVFIPLDTRIGIANKNQADLFISIHANYISKDYVRGTETYVMGLHRAEENLAVAKRENSSILHESDYENTYGGYDPKSSEAHILFSMYQNGYLDKSINFATKVENSFAARTILKSRGVKQAGFLVLRKATMPSALIETGFLSSQEDETYLLSQKGQDEVANAILRAITEYKREVEGEYWLTETNKDASTSKMTTGQGEKSDRREQTPIVTKDHNIKSSNDSETTYVINSKPATNTYDNSSHHKTYSGATGITSHQKSNTEVSPANSQYQGKSAVLTTHESSQKANKGSNKIYKIQIAAGKNKLITTNSSKFKSIQDLEIKKEDNMYKYLTGSFSELTEAYTARESLVQKGFKGAFIVAYNAEKRVLL